MGFPSADPWTRDLFGDLVAEVEGAEMRRMFGNVAGFVDGQMFCGVFGTQLFVRLPPDERAVLLGVHSAKAFEPHAGRPLKEYVVLPWVWRRDTDRLRTWFARSAEWVRTLPAKKKKRKRTKRAPAAATPPPEPKKKKQKPENFGLR